MKNGFYVKREAPVKEVDISTITLDSLEVIKHLGDGQFSRVDLVQHTPSGNQFALKTFDVGVVTRLRKVDDVRFERYAGLLLNPPGHANIVRLLRTFRDGVCVYLLYEYCNGGEVYYKSQPMGFLNEDTVKWIIWQLLEALKFIHSKELIHRDLKAENLMIHNNSCVRLIDFGSGYCPTRTDAPIPHQSRLSHKGLVMYNHYVGSPGFMPPEAIKNKVSTEATDLYALGGTIYQLLTGIGPYMSPSLYLTYCLSTRGDLPPMPPGVSPEATNLIKNLVHPDPEKRLDIEQVKSDPFFKDYVHSELMEIRSLEELCLRSIATVVLNDVESSETSITMPGLYDRVMRQRMGRAQEEEDGDDSYKRVGQHRDSFPPPKKKLGGEDSEDEGEGSVDGGGEDASEGVQGPCEGVPEEELENQKEEEGADSDSDSESSSASEDSTQLGDIEIPPINLAVAKGMNTLRKYLSMRTLEIRGSPSDPDPEGFLESGLNKLEWLLHYRASIVTAHDVWERVSRRHLRDEGVKVKKM